MYVCIGVYICTYVYNGICICVYVYMCKYRDCGGKHDVFMLKILKIP